MKKQIIILVLLALGAVTFVTSKEVLVNDKKRREMLFKKGSEEENLKVLSRPKLVPPEKTTVLDGIYEKHKKALVELEKNKTTKKISSIEYAQEKWKLHRLYAEKYKKIEEESLKELLDVLLSGETDEPEEQKKGLEEEKKGPEKKWVPPAEEKVQEEIDKIEKKAFDAMDKLGPLSEETTKSIKKMNDYYQQKFKKLEEQKKEGKINNFQYSSDRCNLEESMAMEFEQVGVSKSKAVLGAGLWIRCLDDVWNAYETGDKEVYEKNMQDLQRIADSVSLGEGTLEDRRKLREEVIK